MKTRLLKLLLIFNFSFLIFNSSSAQFVLIPDTNFRNFLVNNGFAGCMQGDSLDTTCPAVINATIMNCSSKNIQDLTGINFFSSLTNLDCHSNNLTALNLLPSTLTYLNCSNNQITTFPVLSNSVTY